MQVIIKWTLLSLLSNLKTRTLPITYIPSPSFPPRTTSNHYLEFSVHCFLAFCILIWIPKNKQKNIFWFCLCLNFIKMASWYLYSFGTCFFSLNTVSKLYYSHVWSFVHLFSQLPNNPPCEKTTFNPSAVGCFHCFSVMSSAAMIILVQVSLCGNTGHRLCECSTLHDQQYKVMSNVPQSSCTNLYSLQHCVSIHSCTSSLIFMLSDIWIFADLVVIKYLTISLKLHFIVTNEA